jgi:hypothetical protein
VTTRVLVGSPAARAPEREREEAGESGVCTTVSTKHFEPVGARFCIHSRLWRSGHALSRIFTRSEHGRYLILPTGLFCRGINDRHKLCSTCVMSDLLHLPKVGINPTPDFPTAEQIELAEQVRHQLEERYLRSPTAPSLVQKLSGEDPLNPSAPKVRILSPRY